MALAEERTAANDNERKGVAPPSPTPAPTPEPGPGTALTPAPKPSPELVTKAQEMYARIRSPGSLPWERLSEGVKRFWMDEAGKVDSKYAKADYDPTRQSKLPDGTVIDVLPTDDSGSKSDPPAPAPAPGAHVPEAQHEIPEKVDPLLVTILSWPRKHQSVTELEFCAWLRKYITILGANPLTMAEGCIVVTVKPPLREMAGGGFVSTPSTTLFSCHVDTIEGTEKIKVEIKDDQPIIPRKKLNYDPNFGLIALEKDSIGGSLGADDGAGVWLMLKMIERKVPGTYIFHRGEEVGGQGSKAMAEKYVDMLKAYECAVAFDRHDTFEVIYMQGGAKCASQKFSAALCDRLNKKGMAYQPSSRGVFTDTKNYRKIIPECVNIAVGYQSQHGRNETLDYGHLAALLEAVCAIDWDSLPIDRDPSEPDYYSGYGGYSGGGYGGSYGYGRGRGGDSLFSDDDDQVFQFPQGGKAGKKETTKGSKKNKKKQGALTRKDGPIPTLTISEELELCSLEDLESWCENEPHNAAAALGQLLIEIKQLQASRDMLMKLMGWEDQ